MRDKTLSTTLSAGGRILLALLFVFSQTAWAVDASKSGAQTGLGSAAPAAKAQPNATPSTGAQTSPSQNAEQKETASKGGPHEGIKVHGHWTIEVRNPDGKLVTHREFENGLVIGSSLALILTRNRSVGIWLIQLANNNTTSSPLGPLAGPCDDGSGNATVCQIAEPISGLPSTTYYFLTLGLTTAATPNSYVSSFTLSGTATATLAGINPITYVTTLFSLCPASNPPSTPTPSVCTGGYFQFTAGSALSTPPAFTAVNVSQGQTIAVTVVISFS